MGALIILHGLFLLHCNETTATVGTLKPQYCEILTADTASHAYRVGGGPNFVELPPSVGLSVTLNPTAGKDPDTDRLDARMFVLDSSVVSVDSSKAGTRIVVPMPDNLYGANVRRVFREDVLGNTDSNALRSQPDADNRIALAETVILSYDSGAPFYLMDGGNQVASSATVGRNNVMSFFAWPVASGMSCSTPNMHKPLNQLLLVNKQPPSFSMMGLGAVYSLDDPMVSAFKLPAYLLRPPCVSDTTTERGHDGVRRLRTATQTGCGPGVDIEEK
jgi:hypothetical protein